MAAKTNTIPSGGGVKERLSPGKLVNNSGGGRGVRSRLDGASEENVKGCDRDIGEEDTTDEEMVGARNRGGGNNAGRLRQREVLDLWWLTGMCMPCTFPWLKDVLVAERAS